MPKNQWDEEESIEDGYVYFLDTDHLAIIENHETDNRKCFQSVVDIGEE